MTLTPREPVRARGQFMPVGWDIPVRWAVDAEGVAWASSGHSREMTEVSAAALRKMLDQEHDEAQHHAEELGRAVQAVAAALGDQDPPA